MDEIYRSVPVVTPSSAAPDVALDATREPEDADELQSVAVLGYN